MNDIKFGPTGNSDAFYEAGLSHTYQEPEWLNKQGLNAFEYPYGRGGKFGEATAIKIGEEAKKYKIAMSIHAPYYINLNTNDNTLNIKYFLETCRIAVGLNADRVIFHPGSLNSMSREDAVKIASGNLKNIIEELDKEGFNNILLCPETMGIQALIGTVEDVITLCKTDSRVYPGIDFGHINALTDGGLKTKADYAKILDKIEDGVSEEKYQNMHIHFAHIEYTAKGEKKHLTFEDKTYGPFFEPLAELLWERRLTPIVICESNGTQAQDAVTMMKIYEDCKKG